MMTPASHIRRNVFGCATQQAFADLLGVTQATVSRWEVDGFISRRGQKAMRSAAETRGIGWDDRWLFMVPPTPANDDAPVNEVVAREEAA